MMDVPFDWISAFAGGLLIGFSAVLFLLFQGRIAGISGIFGRVLDHTVFLGEKRKAAASHWSFLFGLFSAGLYWNNRPLLFSSTTATTPAKQSFVNSYVLMLAGFLVGFGTRVGCGCTSGHGICGLSRRSMRSVTAVCVFMFCGMVSASISSRQMLPQLYQEEDYSNQLWSAVSPYFIPTAAVLLFSMAIKYAVQKEAAEGLDAVLPSIFCGALFATGLSHSGMCDPIKVRAFLNVYGILSSEWDPSLMFVMGGALLCGLPLFPFAMKRACEAEPLFGPKSTVAKIKTQVDLQLIVGSALFGIGWGLSGICPGPGLITISSPTQSGHVFPWFSGLLVGAILYHPLNGMLFGGGVSGQHQQTQNAGNKQTLKKNKNNRNTTRSRKHKK